MLVNYQHVDQAAELRRRKRIEQIAECATFMLLSILLILIPLALTVTRIKNPKFRLTVAEVENLSYSPDIDSPSFSMRFHVQVSVENTNFGEFRYENSSVAFAYRHLTVAAATIAKARVPAKSTRNVNVTVGISSDNALRNPKLGNDVRSGMLSLSSYGRLNGTVHLMKMKERRKSAVMNCTMAVNLAEGTIQDLQCN